MNFQRIDTFCEKFVAVLNEILVYGSNEWVESWNISISRQFHTATLRFAIPDFIPEIYEVVLPVDAFDDDQAMEKHWLILFRLCKTSGPIGSSFRSSDFRKCDGQLLKSSLVANGGCFGNKMRRLYGR